VNIEGITVLDEKSIKILEFDKIRQILGGHASFSASRQLFGELTPISDYAVVSHLLNQSAEARRLLSTEPGFSVGGVTDIREVVRMAALHRVLTPGELLEIRHTLEATRKIRDSLNYRYNEFPLLWDIAVGIKGLPSLEKSISQCISPSAEVLDSASPTLANIRHMLKALQGQILERLQSILTSPRGRRIAQEPIVTEREGRYVIPIKIEHRREIKGIVHDISNSGATLFIEPWATLSSGNELRELTLREKRETDKILTELSGKVAACESEISRNIALTAEIDLALAKARYAIKSEACEACLINPDKKGEKSSRLKLVSARHPLLGRDAVPMTLEMGEGFSILVITGPNTGGKTVALKTIGLLCLMTQAGIPIPASEESSIPVFDSVYADIGDEQSIERTLSTFSWHIGNVIRITNNATENSLVLLDELGVSTDPAEGSALARSILLHFLSMNTLTAATTHYSDLKAFAHTTKGFENASLDFDPVTFEPTYQLSIGTPGGSNALATAARLGLESSIITGARDMMAKGTHQLEELLADLMKERKRLKSLRANLEKERDELAIEKAEINERLEKLKIEERNIIQETRDRVVKQAAELHREIQHAASELRKEKKKAAAEQGRQTLASVQKRLKGDEWQTKEDKEDEIKARDENRIGPGDTVWLKEAGIAARVLSVSEDTGQLEIQAGQTRLSLSLERVARITPSENSGLPVHDRIKIKAGTPVLPELDLRGRRADEVETELDSYLNDASLASLDEVRIIHGVGSGTVRNIVQESLANHPLVRNFHLASAREGGEGITIARL
jgi:DNA mismatch repair protein MutS2